MTARWEDFPEECSKILELFAIAYKVDNLPIEYAFEMYHEFIQRPRRHSSYLEAWNEYLGEISSEDVEAREGESTESVTTQIEPYSRSNKSEDSETDGEAETVELPKSEEEVQEKDKENEKKPLDEIEDTIRETSNVQNKDLYGEADSQPMEIKEHDLQHAKYYSNKAEEKSEIDKVIDMICALFATVKLKRIWKEYPLFLKFLGFLTKKRKKTDEIFHLSYKTP
jgi:hypothetical protein